MYDLILQVIQSHTYKDSNALLSKMQRLYIEGELTEEQYTELRMKLIEENPVKTYNAEVEIDKLWKEIREIRAIIDNIDLTPTPTPEPEPSEIPDWVQPTGASDAYMIGDKVKYKGSIYESLIDGNVWAPDVYSIGWHVITE